MANINLIPLIVAAAIVCIGVSTTATGIGTGIGSGSGTTMKASSLPGHLTDFGVQTAVHRHSYGYKIAPATRLYDNRWLPLEEQSTSMLQKPLHRYAAKQDGAATGERRSYRSHSSASGVGAVLNGLTNLSGLGHISNGYGSVAPTHTEAFAAGSSKQEIPIHEEQHEDVAVAAVAAAANDYADAVAGPSGYGRGEQIQQQQQHHSAIYNFPAGAAFQDAWTPSSAEKQQQQQQHQQVENGQHYAYDKSSVGNWENLNQYDQDSGYEAFQQHHVEEQQHQQQQHEQQLEQLQHTPYFSAHEGEGVSAGSGPEHSDFGQHSTGEEQSSNFLSESAGHENGGHGQSHHHVDIINYVPVKHVKKQHVPVEKPVKIPISHAVIIPIKRPVPIHIPITKQVQVEVERELKVPVERIVPVPVEKHYPVPVEKRVPYTVIKYMPIKVPRPYPVKVPVFKTVLHKVKGWW